MPKLAELTTLRLGGPAARFVEARTEDEVVAAVQRGRRDRRAGARAGGRQQPGGRRRGLPGHGRARADARRRARRRLVHGAGGRAVGSVRGGARRATGSRGSSACPGSRARPARRRSRTWAPTGRRSPRSSPPCACSTARTREVAELRPERVRLQLPLERLQARAGRVGRAGGHVRARPAARTRGRSATPSSRARSASSWARARRSPTCARRC